MNNTMEDLVPIVAKLAHKYAGMDSSSISFEKAEQLMEAVIYCITQTESSSGELQGTKDEETALVTSKNLTPLEAYEQGYCCVVQKVKRTLEDYHKVIECFNDYGNRALRDTVKKGLPKFFRWYDARFNPQDTILTLDYPILKDIHERKGIDAIQQYVRCISLEQRFLGSFDNTYVERVLERYQEDYRELIENLCWIVLTDVVGHVLIAKPLKEQNFSQEEQSKIKNLLQPMERAKIKTLLSTVIQQLILKYFKKDEELLSYLLLSCDDITIRLQNAVLHDQISAVFS